MEHWAKNVFSKKVPQNMLKTRSDTTLLVTILGNFGILKVFDFFEIFLKIRPFIEHWAKKLLQKNCLRTGSKRVWTLLRTILDIFGIFENFCFFFENFFLSCHILGPEN